MSKLVLFPRHANRKLRKGEATEEERKVVTQFKGEVLPIRNPEPVIEYRPITEDEKKFQAYKTLRKVRRDAALHGLRAKKLKEAAEENENAPGAKAKAKK
jgi:large subunit ribosomal protein L13e